MTTDPFAADEGGVSPYAETSGMAPPRPRTAARAETRAVDNTVNSMDVTDSTSTDDGDGDGDDDIGERNRI